MAENTLRSTFFLYSIQEKLKIESLYHDARANPQKLLLDTKIIASQRATLVIRLNYYTQQLARTNPASFAFLTAAQKKEREHQLVFTFYLLYAQHQLDSAEKKYDKLPNLKIKMDLCTQYIQKLRHTAERGQEVPYADDLQDAINQSNRSLELLGLTVLAKWFVGKIREIMADKTGTVKDWLTEINGLRLYWVWGGGMLAAALALWPDSLFNKLQTKASLSSISPLTGTISWLLYYTRFGINLFLLIKHTLGPSLIEDDESHIPMWERFKTQWNQRKFALLNDSIWGLINMVTYFWLTGSGWLGYAGGLVTVGLLLMDLVLTTWRFWEEWTNHNQQMQNFKRDKEALLAKRPVLSEEEYELQRAELKKAKTKAVFDWKYKKYGLINDWMYALGLMIAFGVACCFFLPPGILVPATAMIIALAGAALCFVVTVAYAAINAGIAIYKSYESSALVRSEAKILLDKFNTLDDHDPLRRHLYLEIKGLMAESDYQQRLVKFQAIKMARSVMIDALAPFVIFSSLMFLPLGIGLAVLAAALAVAIISHLIVNRFEPQPEQLPEFKEWEYHAFATQPKLTHFAEKKKLDSRFFGKNEEVLDKHYVELAGRSEAILG